MTDLASLAFSVDTSTVAQAAPALDRLRGSAVDLTTANQRLTVASGEASRGFASLGQSAQLLNQQLAQANVTFGGMARSLQTLRTNLDGTLASFRALDTVVQQTEALGRAFGTSASGLLAYNDAAAKFGLTSSQTATSLQRVTMALENQTAVGAELRKTMMAYGVALNDLPFDKADVALQRFTEKLRLAADTAKRTRDMQLVLGNLDPDAMGKIISPNYVPIDTKNRQQAVAAQADEIQRRAMYEADRTRARVQQTDELADLRSNFNGGPMNRVQRMIANGGVTGLSREQLADLRKVAPSDSPWIQKDGLRTEEGQRAFYKQIQGLQSEPTTGGNDAWKAYYAAKAARNVPLFSGPDARITGGFNQFMTHLQDGSYSANLETINNDYYEALKKPGAGLGLAPFARQQFAQISNLFNDYKPKPLPTPEAPDPYEQVGLGQMLAGYGDTDLQRFQAGAQLAQQLGDRSGVKDTAASRVRGSESLGTLSKFYGADAGQVQAFYLQQGRRAQRNAFSMGSDLVENAQTDSNLQDNFSVGDRGKAEAFIKYAISKGADPTMLRGQSLAQLLDPAQSGRGTVRPDLVRNFNKSYEINQQTSNSQFTEQSDRRQGDIYKQIGASALSGTAAEDEVTRQNAYNAALKVTNDETERNRRATIAVKEAQLERLKVSTEALDNEQRANDIESKRIATLASAPMDAVGRATAGYAATMQAQFATANQASGGQTNSTQFFANKQQELANQALESTQQRIAAGTQEVQQSERLLAVAGSRQSVQDKLSRDIAVEQSFVTDIAKANAADPDGTKGIAAQIRNAVEKAKELKDKLAEVNAEAEAFNLGRKATDQAGDINKALSVPRSQRQRFEATQPADQFARDHGMDGGYDSMRDNLARQYGRDPDLIRRLNGVEGVRNPDGSWQTSKDPNSHAAGPMQVQPRTFDAMQKKYGFPGTVNDPEANTRAGILYYGEQLDASGGDPRQAYYRYHDGPATASPSGVAVSTADRMLRGYNGAAAVGAYREGLGNLDDAQQRKQSEDITAQGDVQLRGSNAALGYIRAGQTADAQIAKAGVYDSFDRLNPLKSAMQIRQIMAELQTQFASAQAQTDQTISDNTRMATAYASGADAVGKMTDKLKVEAETRSMKLTPAMQQQREVQLSLARQTQQRAGLAQDLKSSADTRTLDSVDVDLGPFASDKAIARERVRRQTEQTINDKYSTLSPGEKNAKRTDAMQTQDLREATEDVQRYRDAWSQAESATQSALNGLIVSGGNAKQVIGDLTKEFANLLLKLAEKPLMDAGGNWLSSLLGGISKLGGAGGGTTATLSQTNGATAGFVSPAGTGGMLGGAANGAAWVGGMRMMATGGLLDRPTYMMANGGATIAGEAGAEAVMPLRRMPNGQLGIAGGGGGGTSVQVHAPITINGGATGSDGKMDPAVADAISKHMEETLRQAVISTITKEKMPGGSLYA